MFSLRVSPSSIFAPVVYGSTVDEKTKEELSKITESMREKAKELQKLNNDRRNKAMDLYNQFQQVMVVRSQDMMERYFNSILSPYASWAFKQTRGAELAGLLPTRAILQIYSSTCPHCISLAPTFMEAVTSLGLPSGLALALNVDDIASDNALLNLLQARFKWDLRVPALFAIGLDPGVVSANPSGVSSSLWDALVVDPITITSDMRADSAIFASTLKSALLLNTAGQYADAIRATAAVDNYARAVSNMEDRKERQKEIVSDAVAAVKTITSSALNDPFTTLLRKTLTDLTKSVSPYAGDDIAAELGFNDDLVQNAVYRTLMLSPIRSFTLSGTETAAALAAMS